MKRGRQRKRRAKTRSGEGAGVRDADGVYYVGDAAKVHQHLGVKHYAKAMPLIPVEELHAPSVAASEVSRLSVAFAHA